MCYSARPSTIRLHYGFAADVQTFRTPPFSRTCSSMSCACRALALISVLCFSSSLLISLTSGNRVSLPNPPLFDYCCFSASPSRSHSSWSLKVNLHQKGAKASASAFQMTVWQRSDAISLQTSYWKIDSWFNEDAFAGLNVWTICSCSVRSADRTDPSRRTIHGECHAEDSCIILLGALAPLEATNKINAQKHGLFIIPPWAGYLGPEAMQISLSGYSTICKWNGDTD